MIAKLGLLCARAMIGGCGCSTVRWPACFGIPSRELAERVLIGRQRMHVGLRCTQVIASWIQTVLVSQGNRVNDVKVFVSLHGQRIFAWHANKRSVQKLSYEKGTSSKQLY